MNTNKFIISLFLVCTMIAAFLPLTTSHAASLEQIVQSVSNDTSSNHAANQSKSLLDRLFDLIFNKILGPVFNIMDKKDNGNSAVVVKPVPSSPNYATSDSSVLRGKVIVLDPGHGGSNPGAVANNSKEAENNLSVSLKLRSLLTQAGAKVIMTRDRDRTVAAEGSSLGQELQARVSIAEKNHANIFVSIHSNSNPNPKIAGVMTFFPSGKANLLAQEVQTQILRQTKATDKGIAPATFYVLRNTSMPSILVEMGFVTNYQEAALLRSNAYRDKIAIGIYDGIVQYFNKS